MVTKRHSSRRPVKQGPGARAPRIGAATPYHFRGKNLTPYGGLGRHPARKTRLPSAAGRNPHDQTDHPSHEPLFVLALVLGLYVGFARLNQLRFIAATPS